MPAPVPDPQDDAGPRADATAVGDCMTWREDDGRTLVMRRRPGADGTLAVAIMFWGFGLCITVYTLLPQGGPAALAENPTWRTDAKTGFGVMGVGLCLTIVWRRIFEEVRLGPNGVQSRGRFLFRTRTRSWPLPESRLPRVRREQRGGDEGYVTHLVELPADTPGDPLILLGDRCPMVRRDAAAARKRLQGHLKSLRATAEGGTATTKDAAAAAP